MSDGVGVDQASQPGGGKLHISRSRGALSGVLLILAGAWAALVPFVGPYFDFAFSPRPSTSWHWTAARGWYEVLPGGLAAVGGLLLLASTNRLYTIFGAWVAALAGGWLVVTPTLSQVLTLGSIGHPASPGVVKSTVEALSFFSGIGALIVLIAAIAIGRLSVRSVRDVEAAGRRSAEADEAAQREAERQDAEQREAERLEADRRAAEVSGWQANAQQPQQGGEWRPMPAQGQPQPHQEPRVTADGAAPVGSPEPVATTADDSGAYAPGGATPVPEDADDALPEPVPGGPAPDATESPSDESPSDEPPVDESPSNESPSDESPVDESPVDESPVDESPVDADEVPPDAARARSRPPGFGQRVPTVYERRRPPSDN